MIEVVGVGDDGWDRLSPVCRSRILAAQLLVGGSRHLALIPEVAGQERRAWPSPLRTQLGGFLSDVADSNVVALASGDPLRSGVATTLIELLGADQVRVTPALSSETLARARMGWSAEDTEVVTLVGRSMERIRRHFSPGLKLIVLCSGGSDPRQIAAVLTEEGCGDSSLTAWSHLGGAKEQRRDARAADWGSDPSPDLVLLCIEVAASAITRPAVGPAPGRPDDVFDHDGQISKSDIRASALARLRPHPGGVLWDLGAGSGAVAIEWCLAATGAKAIAVEQHDGRAATIGVNAARLGVPSEVRVVRSTVESMLAGSERYPSPAAIFVGGGLNAEVIDLALAALVPGGRLVTHAVTLESEAAIVAAAGVHGGSLARLSVEHAEPLGRFLSWKPARAIVQWSVSKP